MKLKRTITIAGFFGDPDWVGDHNAVELADAAFLKTSGRWTDIEWVFLFADANGNRVGADSGTVNAEVTFRKLSAEGVASGTAEKKYWRGATATGVVAGVLQHGGEDAAGGKTRRPSVEAAIRLTGAPNNPPSGATVLQIWMQGA